jgi:hypothetical protein
VGIEEFVLQISEGVLVELKFALECPISHAAALPQEGHHLVQDLIEPHRFAPLFYRRRCIIEGTKEYCKWPARHCWAGNRGR